MSSAEIKAGSLKVPGLVDLDQELKATDVLAAHRTRMASERTLMGWIRTSISMITFGFTISKLTEYVTKLDTQSRGRPILDPNAPLRVGYLLVIIATLALSVALLQHVSFVRGLPRVRNKMAPVDLAVTTAAFIVVLGVVILLNLLFRIGPL